MLRRAALAIGLLLAAILIQLIILDSLRLPGGTGPDLVLLVVIALALTGGPAEGMLGGFCAGLALDVAPPATHLVGQYALVFCLIGYASGVLGANPHRSAWVPLCVMAVGSAAGELVYALTGMLFGDANVTWSAIRQVLPPSIVYDVLLSPFVLYAVARAHGLATHGLAALRGGTASQPLAVPVLAAASSLAAESGGVLRDSGTGRPPRLKARALRAGATQGGSASGGRAPRRPPARPVQLRLGNQDWVSRYRAGPAARSASRKPGGLRLRGGVMPGGSASGTHIPRGLPTRPVQLRLGSRDWVSRYRAGPAAGGAPRSPGRLRLGSRDWVSRYRAGPAAGGAPRSPGRLRLRGGVMPGGSASETRIAASRPARPVQLRLGSARRRDGTIGGSVLGRWSTGAFNSSRAFGGTPQWRSAHGKAREPRFRRAGPGTINGQGPLAGLGGTRRRLLRRRRGRAMFLVRRSSSKRTGGWR